MDGALMMTKTLPLPTADPFDVSLLTAGTFAIPKQTSLVAVPLFDLLNNASRYGPIIASIPAMLARLSITYA